MTILVSELLSGAPEVLGSFVLLGPGQTESWREAKGNAIAGSITDTLTRLLLADTAQQMRVVA